MEYKRSNPAEMLKDVVKWQSADDTILQMSTEEQADFADYVTKKMCAESPEIVEAFALTTLDGMNMMTREKKIDSAIIGCLAHISLALPPGDTKDRFSTRFAELIRMYM